MDRGEREGARSNMNNGKPQAMSERLDQMTTGQRLEICNALAGVDIAAQTVGRLAVLARSQIYGGIDAEALDQIFGV